MRLIIVMILCLQTIFGWGSRDRVKLKEVTSLILKAGQYTNSRRSHPIPQLKCVGYLCGQYQPSVVQCTNVGFDGKDAQWKCTAEMDSRYKFGELSVSCEGYDYADDPYVLFGSCGLEYRLEYANTQDSSRNFMPQSNEEFSTWSVVLLFIILFFLLRACSGQRSGTASGDNRQPPPYSDHVPPYNPSPSCPPPQQSQGSSGFWTGFATGAFLGSAFNRPSQPTQQPRTRTRQDSPETSSTTERTGYATTRRR